MKKIILGITMLIASISCQAVDVTVKETLVEHPLYQGIVYLSGLTVEQCWDVVDKWMFAYYGRNIQTNVNVGNNFTSKDLSTTITFKDGLQTTYYYAISFEFKEGRIRYTFCLNDYKFSSTSSIGTERYRPRPTTKEEIIKDFSNCVHRYMEALGKYAPNDEW